METFFFILYFFFKDFSWLVVSYFWIVYIAQLHLYSPPYNERKPKKKKTTCPPFLDYFRSIQILDEKLYKDWTLFDWAAVGESAGSFEMR